MITKQNMLILGKGDKFLICAFLLSEQYFSRFLRCFSRRYGYIIDRLFLVHSVRAKHHNGHWKTTIAQTLSQRQLLCNDWKIHQKYKLNSRPASLPERKGCRREAKENERNHPRIRKNYKISNADFRNYPIMELKFDRFSV